MKFAVQLSRSVSSFTGTGVRQSGLRGRRVCKRCTGLRGGGLQRLDPALSGRRIADNRQQIQQQAKDRAPQEASTMRLSSMEIIFSTFFTRCRAAGFREWLAPHFNRALATAGP
jgi:hypothetical protein